MKEQKVCWEIIEQLKVGLTNKEDFESIDILVGILRGGAVVGSVMSNMLNLPIVWCEAKSYVDRERKDLELSLHFSKKDVEGKKVLVCDDIFDSGTTMVGVMDIVKEMGAEDVSGYVLVTKEPWECAKLGVSFIDTCAKGFWCLFPWESSSSPLPK